MGDAWLQVIGHEAHCNREKSFFSACGNCHCSWLRSDLLHAAALLWASPREIVSSACYGYIMAMSVGAVSIPGQSLQVSVPEPWIDSLLPGVRTELEHIQAKNAWLQSGKQQIDGMISDRAAEGFLQIALYCGICFWQNLPSRHRGESHQFVASQVRLCMSMKVFSASL